MIHNVKAIFFDLNNTLHDDSAERFFAAVEGTCQQFAANVSPERLKEAYLSRNLGLSQLIAGTHDERPVRSLDVGAHVWTKVLSEAGITGIDPTAIAASLFRERIRGFEPFPDAHELLQRLSDTYTLGLITNGQTDMQRDTLAALGLESYFPIALISSEFGAGKPSVEIFAEAARRAGAALSECVHIGDSLASDIAGAKESGMTAIWLNRGQRKLQTNDPQPDYTVASLNEVAALLSKRADRAKPLAPRSTHALQPRLWFEARVSMPPACSRWCKHHPPTGRACR